MKKSCLILKIFFQKRRRVPMQIAPNQTRNNNLSKIWIGIFTCQGHINQVY